MSDVCRDVRWREKDAGECGKTAGMRRGENEAGAGVGAYGLVWVRLQRKPGRTCLARCHARQRMKSSSLARSAQIWTRGTSLQLKDSLSVERL